MPDMQAVISGTPEKIYVNSPDELRGAYAAAQGGQDIILTTAGPKFMWSIRRSKPGWVRVQLPREQVYALNISGKKIRTEFVGGEISYDKVTDTDDSSSSYSLDANGATEFIVRSAILGQGKNLVNLSYCEDVLIEDCIAEWARADALQAIGSTRCAIRNLYGRDTVIVGRKIRYFNDGRPPEDGVGNDGVNGWADGPHADIGQFRTGCSHIALVGWDFHWNGQGISNYGATDPNKPNSHFLIADNTLMVNSPNGIDLAADHFTIRDNTLGLYPDDIVTVTPRIASARRVSTSPVQGGRNVALEGARLDNIAANATNAAVDWGAAEINGDQNVELPEAPRVRPLPWGATLGRPEYRPYTGAIDIVGPPGMFGTLRVPDTQNPGQTKLIFSSLSSNSTVEVGVWLTAGLGSTRGFPSSPDDRTWRWLRNGSVIAGTTKAGQIGRVYQVKAADAGAIITVEQQINGGPWKRSDKNAVIPAATVGDPTFRLSPLAYGQPEGDEGVTTWEYTVSRDDTLGAATVDWRVHVDGLGGDAAPTTIFEVGDYPSGTVNFTDGQASATFEFNTLGNMIDDGEPNFYTVIENQSSGQIDQTARESLGTIINDDEATAPAEFVDNFDTTPDGERQTLINRTGWENGAGQGSAFYVNMPAGTLNCDSAAVPSFARRVGSDAVSPQRVKVTFKATIKAGVAFFGSGTPGSNPSDFTGYIMRLNSGATSLRVFRYRNGQSEGDVGGGVSEMVNETTTSATVEVIASVTESQVLFTITQNGKSIGAFSDATPERITSGGYGPANLSTGSGLYFDNWVDGGEVATTPPPAAADLRVMHMGQSEEEQLYQKGMDLPKPQNVPTGNLVYYFRKNNGEAPIITPVSQSMINAGLANPYMGILAVWLKRLHPTKVVAIAAEVEQGTARHTIFNDDDTRRLWSDVVAMRDAITNKYGPIQHVFERWHNSDGADALNYEEYFVPYWTGKTKNGDPIVLGQFVNGKGHQVDHILWDTTGQGRGLLPDTATFTIATPMPMNALYTEDAENTNFSGPKSQRWIEPAREVFAAIKANPAMQQIGTKVGPSSHAVNFGGGIHPLDTYGGGGYYLEALCVDIARKLGTSYVENELDPASLYVPPDRTFVEIKLKTSNGGTLITPRQQRGLAMPSIPSPHQQPITGFELTRKATGQRRPIWRTDSGRDAAFRGAVTISSAIDRTIRIALEQPFQPGDSISYLRGPATAALKGPRDYDNQLYLDMPREHDPRFYDAADTYPFPGHTVKPYQKEIVVP